VREKTLKQKDPLPETMTEREAAEFWDTHSVADYLDELEPVNEEIVVVAPKKRLLSVRLAEGDLKTLRDVAAHYGLGAGTLARVWILERLRSERRDDE
jgi:predicted DNA binding CopG/RHH family protein